MNLICQLRDFFFREGPSASSYDRLLTNLNRACSYLPEGQAFLVTGDGEFTVRLTWKPRQGPPDLETPAGRCGETHVQPERTE